MKIDVILVDDHEMVRAGIRRFLEKADDIRVLAEAGSAEAARDLMMQYSPAVVVIDIKLPDASGIDLVRWLRADYPELKMLIVSAYDDEPYIRAALRAGASGYLLKSAAPVDVIAAVRHVARGRSVIDPALASLLFGIMVDDPIGSGADLLTSREREVLRLAASGQTNKEIGQALTISDRTVQSHLKKTFRKLNVNTRTEAVAIGLEQGLITGAGRRS